MTSLWKLCLFPAGMVWALSLNTQKKLPFFFSSKTSWNLIGDWLIYISQAPSSPPFVRNRPVAHLFVYDIPCILWAFLRGCRFPRPKPFLTCSPSELFGGLISSSRQTVTPPPRPANEVLDEPRPLLRCAWWGSWLPGGRVRKPCLPQGYCPTCGHLLRQHAGARALWQWRGLGRLSKKTCRLLFLETV